MWKMRQFCLQNNLNDSASMKTVDKTVTLVSEE